VFCKIEDPLAKAVRRKLRRAGIDTGIDVVFSTEKPYRARDHVTGSTMRQKNNGEDDEDVFTPLPNFKSSAKLLPVLVPLPAMFGMSMATYIACKIAGWALEPLPIKFREALYQRLHRDLKQQEEGLYGSAASETSNATGFTATKLGNNNDEDKDFPLDRRDVGYLVEEMFRGRSAVSKSMDRIVVCRWKNSEPLSLLNAVVLTQQEMEKHVTLPVGMDLVSVYGKEVVDYVELQFQEERQISCLH
jgi:hypothetical protein